MIVTQNQFSPNQVLDADICIVGSGPAAISMALQLTDSSLRVLMLTGGDWSETVTSRDLYRGSVWPAGSHEPLEENRRRQFGGTSAAWGGRCMPFDPIDFETRSWVNDSGWPISHADLLPYYHKAADLCQIGRFEFDAHRAFPDAGKEILEGLDFEKLISQPLERWSPPVHFAKEYQSELSRSKTVQVLLNAHVLTLETDQHTDTVSHAVVRMGDLSLTVKATTFVVAAGGIENCRLLLASQNRQFPTGLGNQHDNVGRYYMVHISGTYAEVKPASQDKLTADFEFDEGGVYCRRRWWFPEEAQAEDHLLNTIMFLYHANSQNGHRDVLFSSRFVAKALLSIAHTRSLATAKQQLPALKEHTANILLNGLSELPSLVQTFSRRMAKRRLPYVLPSKKNEYWGLYFQAEQAPNPNSRITLSKTQRDSFGIPRADIQLAFLDIDVDSIVKTHQIFVDRFRAQQLGDIHYSEAGLRQYIAERFRSYNSASHHIGTTRMADNPADGVVDRDSRVHGVTNVYVVGSSVFPTGSHANPTLTIVAHALRVADQLKRLSGPVDPAFTTSFA